MNLLSVRNISKSFHLQKGFFSNEASKLTALDDVSISLEEGGFSAIIGESGSGKTTLGKIICRLIGPDQGEVLIDSKNINEYSRFELSEKVQMIFQDPFASLNPKLTIKTILSEAVQKPGGLYEIENILSLVGLTGEVLSLYPHHFSGGQRQRIAIARALLKKPRLIIADEPLSSLDISIQAQILDMFVKLKNSLSISFIFISHDIVAASNVADFFYIMKNGIIVEQGETQKIISSPTTDYAKNLLNSVPT
jgi:ABC-type oligopeptide transport system ATPase subunit